VEGTQPRPEGLTEKEQEKLKEYARRTVELMVERRKRLEERLSASPVNAKLRRHAAVATNLGAIMYRYDECVTAMMLLQQAVQTLMYVEEDQNGGPPAEEHQDRMAQLLTLMSYEANTPESIKLLLTQVAALVRETGGTITTTSVGGTATPPLGRAGGIIDGIPGLFSPTSKLTGPASDHHLPTLVFAEAFQVSLDDTGQPKPIDERQFTILIEQCSKATLFNMGLIHYHWGSPDSAMQFFDLAASLSHANAQTPLAFDPVVLGCLNNMAQINLQYGNPKNAMEMLTDALTRGNAALAAIYGEERPDSMQQDVARTRRLRRKLSRTVMNMAHVHFFKCDYDAAMIACNDALRLLHSNIEDTEAAAVWYNIGMLQHHKGDRTAALKYLDMFLERVRVLMGPKDLQMAEGLHRRGMILFEMGNLYESMKPLNEALSIRRSSLGPNHAAVAESLCLIGKVLLAREEYDFALNALQEGLSIQRKLAGEEGLSFEAAQTLLEVGRAYHAQNELKKSREVYEEVVAITRRLFGDRHPFVARLDIIIGNIFLSTGNVDDSLVLFSEATHIHQEQGLPVDLGIVTDPLLGVERDHNSVAPTA
jgi:tetratricopeptide (TPR) repeat protein